jgi:hypothetical protein
MDKPLDGKTLDLALRSLDIRLADNRAEPVEIVVCGGSALILTGMVPRTTKDVDVVALIRAGKLLSPDPFTSKTCMRSIRRPMNWRPPPVGQCRTTSPRASPWF